MYSKLHITNCTGCKPAYVHFELQYNISINKFNTGFVSIRFARVFVSSVLDVRLIAHMYEGSYVFIRFAA